MIYSEQYWNDKNVKRPIIYGCRTMRNSNTPIEIDVRNFISANDALLQKYIEQYGLKKETYNETALAIQKFIVNNFTYIGDLEGSGVNEFWQFAFESMYNKVFDCEDGSILMASLMINAGIPEYRVRVVAGYVKPSDTAPTSGHCYCTYLADRNDGTQEFVPMDWCYFQDTELKCEDKPLLKDGGYNNCYKEIWWSFNSKYSWSKEEVLIEQPRVNK